MFGLHKKSTSYWIIIQLLIIVVVTTVFFCNIMKEKHSYRQQAQKILDDLHEQQQFILQRLAKDLAKDLALPLQSMDLNKIVIRIKSLEDLSFILSKRGLTVPVTAHVVSLSARHPIIGSDGIVDTSVLAPDENYYLQAVENPAQLGFSKLYAQPGMPDYWLYNWGLGISNQSDSYGHLDVRVARECIEDFLSAKLGNSDLFVASISNRSPWKVSVNMQLKRCLLKFSQWIIIVAIVDVAFFSCLMWLLNIIFRSKKLKQENTNLQDNLFKLEQDIARYQRFVAVQNKYRGMIHDGLPALESVDLQAILSDVADACGIVLHQRAVHLQLPDFTTRRLLFKSSQLFLMRILSGIVCECAQLLPPNSKISLQVEVSALTIEPRLEFIFKDNGYYTTLTKQCLATSASDITCLGWENIIALISEFDGNLEHKHAAYHGNTILCTIPYQAMHKVINLADYCMES